MFLNDCGTGGSRGEEVRVELVDAVSTAPILLEKVKACEAGRLGDDDVRDRRRFSKNSAMSYKFSSSMCFRSMFR